MNFAIKCTCHPEVEVYFQMLLVWWRIFHIFITSGTVSSSEKKCDKYFIDLFIHLTNFYEVSVFVAITVLSIGDFLKIALVQGWSPAP